MTSENLNLKYKTRKYMRSQVTKAYNEVQNFPYLTLPEKSAKRSKLISLSEDLKAINADIQKLQFVAEYDDSQFEMELERCSEYTDKIFACLAHLDTAAQVTVNGREQLLKSPVAPLPTFKGNEDECLSKFVSSFEDTISRYNYAEYDKYLLLKQQLGGRALVLIDSLESNRTSYSDAKQLLESAFASHPIQKFNTIKQISRIKLQYEQDPFEYISNMRKLTESVNVLKISTDDFLEYFFWIGLNNQFRDQLVQITNNSHPTLKEIQDNFFVASERYSNLQKRSYSNKPNYKPQSSGNKVSPNPKSLNMAVSLEDKSKPFKSCTLCKDEKDGLDHPIYRCSAFPDPGSKVRRLIELGGCTKCGQLNHNQDKCKFKLQRRCKCGSFHFSFLCQKFEKVSNHQSSIPKPDNNSNKVKIPENVSNNASVIVDSFQNFSGSETILPTFTCSINNYYQVRGLRDGGSQCNFILDSIAKDLNLKAVQENIKLQINGFNGPQNYVTRTVKLTINGDEDREIEAICIPEIKINLYLPKLTEVALEFCLKGYTLADKILYEGGDSISNLDFVLGSNSFYCLKAKEYSFGSDRTSVYADTSLGVILLGNANTILNDLPYLPERVKRSPKVRNDIQSVSEFEQIHPIAETEETSINFVVMDENEKVNRSVLEKATAEILKPFAECDVGEISEIDLDLVKFTLDNTTRTDEGRLLMPLLWRNDVSHLLGHNFTLAKSILNSNLKKLEKKPSYLGLMDDVFKEQVESGILERIPNLDQFMRENPDYSFLAHMGVFRLKRETSKCRVVYLSNLCGNDSGLPLTVSHNQAMHSGPSMNQKLSNALLHLRFDSKLLIFDLSKAFNMIQLSEKDSTKLLCLWYRDVSKKDYTLVGYRNCRLPFGLRCSPTLLMLGLYKILILDSHDDLPFIRNLKHLIYQCIYMDNGAFTANDSSTLMKYYEQLDVIFSPYRFAVQQIVTNDCDLQTKIEDSNELYANKVKLLGLWWDRSSDTLCTNAITLNKKARNKRLILKSIAEQYDLYNFNAPLLNRAKLFIHDLQCNKDLSWDTPLNETLYKEWCNIVNQANSSSLIEIPRMMGRRDDRYKLIACTDASTRIYGTVIYVQNLSTNKVTFVLSKNRVISRQLESKSVPSLELQAVALGVETVLEVYGGISGQECTIPINVVDISVYSDSLVALSWINAYCNKFEKMQKRTVFIMNRIKHIQKLCSLHPIQFTFISGTDNPADFVTRCFSSKLLLKSNYVTGPTFLKEESNTMSSDILSFIVPNPNTKIEEEYGLLASVETGPVEDVIKPEKFSSFLKLVRVHAIVLQFIHKLKCRRDANIPDKTFHQFYEMAIANIIRKLQEHNFKDVYNYFESGSKKLKDIPNIIRQLNVYKDREGLLRIKSKFGRWQDSRPNVFPLLLPKVSHITNLIILDLHKQYNHSGCYTILSELKKRFWVPHCFSVVKKALKGCVNCKRFNERTVQCNQNSYRDFRVDPPSFPFGYIFMDYIGPFEVREHSAKKKVWILCISCLWSRAVNLKICTDFSTQNFLRAFQLHTFEWGLPQLCISDLGSQMVAGTKIISDFLKDAETQMYFAKHGVKSTKFDNYVKGKSELGSLVESSVKQVKKLIFSSVGKKILSLPDFDFLVQETLHLINRRPIAFKESLRNVVDDISSPITPELLIKGYELFSLNVIPELQYIEDPNWTAKNQSTIIKDNYDKLRKARETLKQKYHEEFLSNLITQATDKQNRYKPKYHKLLDIGDIVLIKEPNCKAYNYPMGIIQALEQNNLGENTSATILKGKTREITRRHVSSLIPLLSRETNELNLSSGETPDQDSREARPLDRNLPRLAARAATERNKRLFGNFMA